MTVVNPKSISGINSITMASGSDDLLTIHSNNTTERVRVNNSGDVIVGSGVTLSPDGDIFATGVCTATSFSGDGSALTGVAATDNVRTGILDVAGVGTFRNDVNIPDKIIHLGDTNTAIRFPADDTITAETSGSEVVRIDSNGHVALKLTDPHLYYSKDLVIKAISEGGITIRANGGSDWNYLMFASGNSGTARYSGYIGFDHGNDKLRLSTNEEVSAKNVELRSDGNFHISDGNLVLASGHGIDFSATGDGSAATSVAEVLDDYEEGLFTPYMAYSTTQNDFAYSAQVGQYVKIGKLVTFQARVNLTSAGSGSGNVKFTNFPFAPSPSSGSLSNPMVTVKPVVGVDVGGDREIFAQFEGGNTSLVLYTFGIESSSDYASFTQSNIDNNAQVAVFGHYYTDS